MRDLKYDWSIHRTQIAKDLCNNAYYDDIISLNKKQYE